MRCGKGKFLMNNFKFALLVIFISICFVGSVFAAGPTPTQKPQPIPSITVLSPNGGEQWTFGNPQVITWKSNGIKNATIYLIANDGMLKLADVNASLGRYRFTPQENQGWPGYVKKLTPGQYKVDIWSTDRTDGAIDMNDPNDVSDGFFSIVAPPVVSNIGLTIPPYSQMRLETSNFGDGSSSLEMTAVKFMLWGWEWRIPVTKNNSHDLTLCNNFSSKEQKFTLELKGIGVVNIYINSTLSDACLIIARGPIWLPKLPPMPEL